MARLDGRRVVITGSSRGLGRAFAEAAAAAGAKVVVNGTNADLVAEVVDGITEAGGTAVACVGDVSEEAQAQALIETCVTEYGGIDALVNNAGIVRDRTLMKMSVEEWDAVMAVNLRGPFLCTKHAAIAMRDADPQGGHIVQVISASGLSGGFGQGNYAAAKEGMIGMMRSALLEFTPFGIRNNAFWPIGQTDMTQVIFDRANAAAAEQNQPAPDPIALGFGRPEEVAQGMVWYLSDSAAHLNGQIMTFNGRKTALWQHPSETHVTFSQDAIKPDDLDAHFGDVESLPVYRPVHAPK